MPELLPPDLPPWWAPGSIPGRAPHTAYPQITDPISDQDFLMLEALKLKFPYLEHGIPAAQKEQISRERLKDAAKMRARAYDYEHKDDWYRPPRRQVTTWRDTAGPLVAATATAAMIAAAMYAVYKNPWEKSPVERMPFEFNPTILLWDLFEIGADVPPVFEVIRKHPSIQVKILPSGGLNYTQCLRVRWPSAKRAAWRGVTLRWYHNLPLRNVISYGFIHHGGHITSPHHIDASANFTFNNSLFRSGFYTNVSDILWPAYLQSYPSNVKFSLPYGEIRIPGYYCTCSWTIVVDKAKYLAATVNNAALPVEGCPVRMYGKKELVLPFIEIELWHGWEESCDYYLDNVTVLSTGELLPGLDQELYRRTTTWPIKDILFDPHLHPETLPA